MSVQAVTDTTLLDTKPDARQVVAGAASSDGKPAEAAAEEKPQPLPANHQAKPNKKKVKDKKPADKTPSATTPAATTTSATTPSDTPATAKTPSDAKQ